MVSNFIVLNGSSCILLHFFIPYKKIGISLFETHCISLFGITSHFFEKCYIWCSFRKNSKNIVFLTIIVLDMFINLNRKNKFLKYLKHAFKLVPK